MTEPLKVSAIEKCDNVRSCYGNPLSYGNNLPRMAKASQTQIAEYALNALNAARAKDIAAHEQNLIAIGTNTKIRDQVTKMMTDFGIPQYWNEPDPRSRAMFPKRKRVDAGYVADLAKCAPVTDGFARSTEVFNALEAKYKEFLEKAKKADEEASTAHERQAEIKKAQRKADLQLASIIIRYQLKEDATWAEALEALRTKDQRLDLAIAMSQTRGDWSEGFWRVEDALKRFRINSDEDKEIAANVLGCCRSDCDDGRIFRDTEWNYSRLLESIADRQLVADADIARSHAE